MICVLTINEQLMLKYELAIRLETHLEEEFKKARKQKNIIVEAIDMTNDFSILEHLNEFESFDDMMNKCSESMGIVSVWGGQNTELESWRGYSISAIKLYFKLRDEK